MLWGGAAIECGKMHDHFTFAGLMSRTSLLHCCCCFLCLVAVVWMGCYLKCITKPLRSMRSSIVLHSFSLSLFGCVVSLCVKCHYNHYLFLSDYYMRQTRATKNLSYNNSTSRLGLNSRPNQCAIHRDMLGYYSIKVWLALEVSIQVIRLAWEI